MLSKPCAISVRFVTVEQCAPPAGHLRSDPPAGLNPQLGRAL